MYWRDYSVQASGSSFPPAGQSCPVTHCSAAFTQESWGEATAGPVVPHHTLQPAEPHAAALASVQWRGGCRQLQQPSWGHATAELQQGKHTERCTLALQTRTNRSKLFQTWTTYVIMLKIVTFTVTQSPLNHWVLSHSVISRSCCHIEVFLMLFAERAMTSEPAHGPRPRWRVFSVGAPHLVLKQASDKLQQDAPVVHESCCKGDWRCNPLSLVRVSRYHFVQCSHAYAN